MRSHNRGSAAAAESRRGVTLVLARQGWGQLSSRPSLPSSVATLRTLQPRVFVNNHRDQVHKTCSPSDTHLALRSHGLPAAAAGLPRLGIRRETNSTKYIGKSLIYEVNRTAAVCFHRYTSLPIFIQTRREGKVFIFSVEQLVCAITTTLLAILCHCCPLPSLCGHNDSSREVTSSAALQLQSTARCLLCSEVKFCSKLISHFYDTLYWYDTPVADS